MGHSKIQLSTNNADGFLGGAGGTDQDSVRLLAVECCGPLAKLCEQEDIISHILPVVKKFAQAWTVILHAHPFDFRPYDH